jgi:DNA-binding CsgD family transcriptional regulator
VSGWSAEAARKLLEGVVPDRLLEAYLKLLDEAGCPVEDAETLLGGSNVVQALRDRGMAHVTPRPHRLVPAASDLALQGALRELGRQLVEDQDRLIIGHQRLGEVQRARAELSELADHSVSLVEVVTDREEIKDLSYSLMNAAHDEWLTLENLAVEIPLDAGTACGPLPTFPGGLTCRSIYETKSLDHPVACRLIEEAVAAGEQARLLPRIGMKMKLADEAVAMVPLTPTGLEGALVVRSAVVVAALREYFEMLWEKATPFGSGGSADGSGLSETDRQILQLMAAGMKDEPIARRLNIGVGTVRRHVTSLAEMLKTEGRFAMGAAAVRRGWIK